LEYSIAAAFGFSKSRQRRIREKNLTLPIFLGRLRTLDNRTLTYAEAEAGIQDTGDRGGTVKHFSITEWADFVRDVATEELSAQMRKHLDEGCSGCMETVRTWKSVAEYARQEAYYEPPSSSLRIANSYFAPFKSASKQAAGMLIARLTFDSFASRMQLGIRGSSSLPRQLMYRCDDVFIDLRLEPKFPSRQVVLVGQIADSGQPARSVDGIAVSLLRGGDTLSQASTNQFGEFHFSLQESEEVRLVVGLKETAIVVSLPDTEWGEAVL
jgi:hypothetical protein